MTPRTRLDKKDYRRALLTDTAPGDVPIIFSNDGLYLNCHSFEKTCNTTASRIFHSISNNVLDTRDSQSAPYKYGIRKGEVSTRTLSLLHPRVQLGWCRFYRDYSDAINYLCSRSDFSIRAPYKVSNSYYERDSDKESRYKEIDIDTLENELTRRHGASYFSYRGHNRLFKFFNSPEYVSMEKRFSVLWTLDVSNCFDSIYTHTLSWAVKGKEYSKQNVAYRNQFCAEFDRLMQRSNNNETNGIPIGSEVSRIFSEVIFQSIDADIVAIVGREYGYQIGADYAFFRYVDDFLLFSKSVDIAADVSRAISDALQEYNLYINASKLKKYRRPFNTEKSNTIRQVKRVFSEFETKVLVWETIGETRSARPKKINRAKSLIRSFIEQVKNVCHADSSDYSDVSSYLISAFSNRVVRLLDGYRLAKSEFDDQEKLRYRDLVMVYLRLMFFFFAVSPEVRPSYKLAKTIIVVDKFFLELCPEFSDHFRTMVVAEVEEGPLYSDDENIRGRCVSLEGLNVLLATSEFGPNYLVPEERLFQLLKRNEAAPYFAVVSLLYYIQTHIRYVDLRRSIEKAIVELLVSSVRINKDSEAAHLFLDVLSCPYVSLGTRERVLREYLGRFEPDLDVTPVELTAMLEELQSVYWFVKWNGLDLIKLLERKELNAGY